MQSVEVWILEGYRTEGEMTVCHGLSDYRSEFGQKEFGSAQEIGFGDVPIDVKVTQAHLELPPPPFNPYSASMHSAVIKRNTPTLVSKRSG
jgi:hypothetical protein